MEPQFHSLFCVGNISVILPHARMLSYRAENIHERLEPQELYEREEMEEAVQIEVCRNSVCSCSSYHTGHVGRGHTFSPQCGLDTML